MVRQRWNFTERQGGGQEDITEIIKHLESWARITLPKSG